MTVLRESPWYQEILKEGVAKGEQRGLQQGLQRGEATLVLRLLSKRFGTIDEGIALSIRQMNVSSLELLGESLLDFQSLEDLHNWLQQHG